MCTQKYAAESGQFTRCLRSLPGLLLLAIALSGCKRTKCDTLNDIDLSLVLGVLLRRLRHRRKFRIRLSEPVLSFWNIGSGCEPSREAHLHGSHWTETSRSVRHLIEASATSDGKFGISTDGILHKYNQSTSASLHSQFKQHSILDYTTPGCSFALVIQKP